MTGRSLRLILSLQAALALGAGCAAPPPKPAAPPPVPHAPAGPPPQMPGGSRLGPAPSSPGMVPDREVQARLLQEGRSAYAQGQYAGAVRQLWRLVKPGVDAATQAEGRWWLAQAYERLGQLKEAAAEYRALAQMDADAGSGRIDRAAVARRIQELDQVLGGRLSDFRGATAVFVPAHRLADPVQTDRWLEDLRAAGVTTLVVDAGTNPAGVHFQTALAPVAGDVLSQLVPSAHRRGLAVVAALTLRRMAWVDPALGWSDRSFDPAAQELHATPSVLDLFHPAFQAYLVGLLTDLAATGVDGLLFKGDAPLGPMEGLSPFGLQGFEREFGVPLTPASLFAGPARSEPPPEFWRWAGWRARETLAVMDRLARAVRARSPRLAVGLEVHPEAALDPSAALVRYAEDLLEAKRSGFDFYLVGNRGTGALLADRAVGLIGDAGRVWVAQPVSERALARPASRLTVVPDRAGLPLGVGLLYRVEGRAVP